MTIQELYQEIAKLVPSYTEVVLAHETIEPHRTSRIAPEFIYRLRINGRRFEHSDAAKLVMLVNLHMQMRKLVGEETP